MARHSPPNEALLDEALLLVARIHSGERDAPKAAALEAWAGQSAAHARSAREARGLWQELGGLRPMPDRRAGAPSASRRVFMLGGLGLAATGAGAFALAQRGTPGQIATGTGETRSLTLAGGDRIELSARSGIDLGPTTAGAPVRQARLRAGQAWFDIRPSDPPFGLAAERFELEIREGALALDLRAGDGSAILGLEGADLRLRGHGRLDPQASFRLSPGAAPERLPRPSTELSAWRSGWLVAEEMPLGEIVAELGPWYSGWIRLADPGLAALAVTAVLDLRRPEAALRSLEQGLPIRLRSYGGLVLSIGHA